MPPADSVGSSAGTDAGAIKHGVDASNGPIKSLDANGCPTLTSGATTAIVTALQSNTAGSGAGKDFFAKGNGSADQPLSGNVLSIVLTVDKSLLSSGGAIVGVWGSTNKAQ